MRWAGRSACCTSVPSAFMTRCRSCRCGRWRRRSACRRATRSAQLSAAGVAGQPLQVLAVGVHVQMSWFLSRVLTKAMRLPSGDQRGDSSNALCGKQVLVVGAVGVDGVDLQLAVGALRDCRRRRRSACRRATSGRRSAAWCTGSSRLAGRCRRRSSSTGPSCRCGCG